MKLRLFLSFDYDDRHQVQGFRLLKWNRELEFDFYDESLPEKIDSRDAEYIKRKLRERIKRCSVLVCLIGDKTYKSDWVDWEIRYAADIGKGLVGVKLKGKDNAPVPKALKENQAEVVSWDVKAIERAIERAAEKRGGT